MASFLYPCHGGCSRMVRSMTPKEPNDPIFCDSCKARLAEAETLRLEQEEAALAAAKKKAATATEPERGDVLRGAPPSNGDHVRGEARRPGS